MKKRVLAICDDENRYAQLLHDFLYAKFPVPMQLIIFSNLEALKKYATTNEIEILLIAQHIYRKEIKQKKIKNCYLLREKEISKEPLQIFKYQSAKGILNDLLEQYGKTTNVTFQKEKRKAEIIGIYTPIKRTGQTVFSLLLGQCLAKKRRTLYINVEPYAGFSAYLKRNYANDLSDLLYYLSYEKEKFVYKLGNMVDYFGNLEYLPPSCSFLDLQLIAKEEWIKFLNILQQETEYEYVILDLSENIMGLFDVLRQCSRVYTPIKEDQMAVCKISQYETLLKQLEYDDVLDKAKKISTPQFIYLDIAPEELPYCQMAKIITEIIGDDFRDDV